MDSIYLSEMFSVFDVSEDAPGQRVKDIEAMQTIAAGDQNIQVDQGGHVGSRNAQRRVQTGHKVGQFTEGYELRCVRVKPVQATNVASILIVMNLTWPNLTWYARKY